MPNLLSIIGMIMIVATFSDKPVVPPPSPTSPCASNNNCALPSISNDMISNCNFDPGSPGFGSCDAASCEKNFDTSSSVTCNGASGSCGLLQPGDNDYSVGCTKISSLCTNKCFGFTYCAQGSCPDNTIGLFCFTLGASNNYKVCSCSSVSSGFVSQCPSVKTR